MSISFPSTIFTISLLVSLCSSTPLDVPHDVFQATSVLHGHQRGDLDVLRGGASGRLLVGLRLLLAGGHGVVAQVSTGAVGSQMGVVDSRVERDRSRGAHVVVRVLEDEGLQLRSQPPALVEDALVMDGASGTLDGHVGAEIKVELEGVRAAGFDQGTRERIAVAVTLAGVGAKKNVS